MDDLVNPGMCRLPSHTDRLTVIDDNIYVMNIININMKTDQYRSITNTIGSYWS